MKRKNDVSGQLEEGIPDSDWNEMLENICDFYGISLEQLMSSTVRRPLPMLRMFILFRLWHKYNYSFAQASAALGKRYSIANKAVKTMLSDPNLMTEYLNLFEK